MRPKHQHTQWTSTDLDTLYDLVARGTPARLIAQKLGRTEAAVRSKAKSIDLSTKPTNPRPAAWEATVVCRLVPESGKVIVELSMPLEADEPAIVTAGCESGGATHFTQGKMWHPWTALEFALTPKVFALESPVTLGVSLEGYTPEAPEWGDVAWVWQGSYQAVMSEDGPRLLEMT